MSTEKIVFTKKNREVVKFTKRKTHKTKNYPVHGNSKKKVEVPISKTNLQNTNVNVSDSQILQALIQTRGLPAKAARLLKTSYSVIIDRLNKNPQIFHEYKTFEQEMIDKIIEQCDREIETGNTQIILHFLKTWGRERGLGEQKTVTLEGNPEKPINVKFELNLIGLTNDELMTMKELIKKAIDTYENHKTINPFEATNGTFLKPKSPKLYEHLRRATIAVLEEPNEDGEIIDVISEEVKEESIQEENIQE